VPGNGVVRVTGPFEEPGGKEAAMNRRAFLSALTGSLLAVPLAADAQPAGQKGPILA
jgi:hypothetical protein